MVKPRLVGRSDQILPTGGELTGGVNYVRLLLGVKYNLGRIPTIRSVVRAALLRVLGRLGPVLATELSRRTIELAPERAVECRF